MRSLYKRNLDSLDEEKIIAIFYPCNENIYRGFGLNTSIENARNIAFNRKIWLEVDRVGKYYENTHGIKIKYQTINAKYLQIMNVLICLIEESI